ncbi:MAG: PASTA domain-containing protein [Bacteroidota bacterium]
MSFKKPTNIKDLFIHLGVMVGVVVSIILLVFYLWLPLSTNHGDTITIPNLVGMGVTELPDFLDKRDLRFEITQDSSFSSEFEPLAVLRQVPAPNSKVKENRKIYVTLNSANPPKVRMPELVDRHLKSAQKILKSYDLKLGKVIYTPDVFFGVVHEARMNNRVVLAGEKVEKSSLIDLVVGDGYGNQELASPNLLGLDQEEAEFVIIGSGLKVAQIRTTGSNTIFTRRTDRDGESLLVEQIVAPGEVQKQSPIAGTKMRIGDVMEIWIYKTDSISSNTTILDNP